MADLVNFYDALGIDPSEPTESIRERLERIKVGQTSRAGRPDATGEKAREQLALISQAEPFFRDDDARDEYDRNLRTLPTEEGGTPDWLQLAWSYYFQEDYGPAEVAARKAREADRENPSVWVVSAWIELAPVTRHPLLSDESWEGVLARFRKENRSAENDPQSALTSLVESAKRYADEAYTPHGSEAAGDVAHVRGVCFYFLKDLPRAIQSYKTSLLAVEDPTERAELNLRTALAYEVAESSEQSLSACEGGLSTDTSVPPQLTDSLEMLWSRTVIAMCEGTPLTARENAYNECKQRISASPVRSASILSQICDANAQRLAQYTSDQSAAAAARQRLSTAQQELSEVRSQWDRYSEDLSRRGGYHGLESPSMEVLKERKQQLSKSSSSHSGEITVVFLVVACIVFVVSVVAFFLSFGSGSYGWWLASAGVSGWLAWGSLTDKEWKEKWKDTREARAQLALISGAEREVSRTETMIAQLQSKIEKETTKAKEPVYPQPIYLQPRSGQVSA